METSADTLYRVRVLEGPLQLEVELTLRGLTPGTLHLELPTWVPGAYAFMRYARDLIDVRAEDAQSGKVLGVTREGRSGFRVDGVGDSVRVTYRASGSDVSFGELCGVVGHDQAVILGTRYLYVPGRTGPCRVRYEVPEGWPVHHPAGAKKLEENLWEYESYASLLDTPVCMGRFDLRTRKLGEVPFHHLFVDRALGFPTELEGFIDDVMKVVERTGKIFGGFPFEGYTFVYTFDPRSGWGLEHTHATMVTLGSRALIDPEQRLDALRVCAHELFHAWNVCRLKPSPLGNPDRVHGSFPDALWVSEGFTRYYEFVLCARSGAMTVERVFSNVVNYYAHLSARPAYARASPKDSSLATFLNHSRYPGAVNNSIDFYDAGMLVAFDLDVLLRGAGLGLDEVFADFYRAKVGQGDGFTSADLAAFFGERCPEAKVLLEKEVEHAGALSVPERLASLGWAVAREKVRHLGLVLEKNVGPKILDVVDTSPAGRCGLSPDDEILRVEDFPFDVEGLTWQVAHAEEVLLEVRRGHQTFRFTVPTGEREVISGLTWRGTEAQAAAIRAWLGREDFRPEDGQKLSLDAYDNFHGIQKVI